MRHQTLELQVIYTKHTAYNQNWKCKPDIKGANFQFITQMEFNIHSHNTHIHIDISRSFTDGLLIWNYDRKYSFSNNPESASCVGTIHPRLSEMWLYVCPGTPTKIAVSMEIAR